MLLEKKKIGRKKLVPAVRTVSRSLMYDCSGVPVCVLDFRREDYVRRDSKSGLEAHLEGRRMHHCILCGIPNKADTVAAGIGIR